MLGVLEDEQLPQRVRELAPRFEAIVHALADAPGVVGIRNLGLAAGIELSPDAAGTGQRGARAQAAAFDRGVLTRAPGDTLILAPPFVSSEHDIQRMADRLRLAIEDTASPEL
jgi:beta-alanine--pyruvate transaminase